MIRRTELQRGTSRLKRSPLAKVSRKRAKQLRSPEAQARAAWLAGQDRCFFCGRHRLEAKLDPHEIVPRSKTAEWTSLALLLALCRRCHDTVFVWLPCAAQCAVKKLSDREHYSLAEVNRLRGGAGKVDAQSVKCWEEVFSILFERNAA